MRRASLVLAALFVLALLAVTGCGSGRSFAPARQLG